MITDYRDPAFWTQRKPAPPAWPAVEPVPEVLSTDPWPLEAPDVPRAVLGLQRAAQTAGWVAMVGYSRSPERAVRVGTYKMTESFSVWASVHPVSGWRFNAIHTRTVGAAGGWTWRSTAIWKAGRPRFSHATITDLLAFVALAGDVPLAWFKGVHARVVDQAEEAKRKARERPATKKGKEGAS